MTSSNRMQRSRGLSKGHFCLIFRHLKCYQALTISIVDMPMGCKEWPEARDPGIDLCGLQLGDTLLEVLKKEENTNAWMPCKDTKMEERQIQCSRVNLVGENKCSVNQS